jgi:outer membrane protein TolC
MRMARLTTSLLFLAPFCILAASSPAAMSRALSLDEAIRLGLSRNPALAAVRSEAEASTADARTAEALRWPRLTAEAGARRTDHQVMVFGDKLTAGEFTAGDFALDNLNNPDPVSHLSTALALEAPLYTSGRLRWGIESARDAAGMAQAGLHAAEVDLTARITEAYFAIALARAAVGMAETSLSDARGHESVAAARFEAGAALKSDHLRVQVFRLGRERDLDRRQADLAVATSRFARLLGLDPGEAPELTTPLEAPTGSIGSLDEWTARAMQGAGAIEVSRRAADAAESRARSARSALGPELSGFARYERNSSHLDAGQGSYLLGVGLRWAAFDRARAFRISSAEAHRVASVASSRAVEDSVLQEVEQAFHDAAVAERSLAVNREAQGAAEEARRISAERYEGGLLPLTDLLDVETELMNTRLSGISALYETVVGRVRLASAAGTLEVPR